MRQVPLVHLGIFQEFSQVLVNPKFYIKGGIPYSENLVFTRNLSQSSILRPDMP